MKIIRLSTFAIFVSLSLAFTSAAFGKDKDDEDADAEDEVTIEKVNLVRETADKFEWGQGFQAGPIPSASWLN